MASMTEAAAHLQMSLKNMQELLAKGTISRKNRGEYDLDEVRKEYIAHIREVASGRAKNSDLDLGEERARLAKEQADAKEMENAKERGELVYIEDVAKKVEASLAKVRAKLLAIPTKVAAEATAAVSQNEVRTIIETAIIEALNELARADQDEAD
jgi:terminase small subunit / prophage DNA-packing protein